MKPVMSLEDIKHSLKTMEEYSKNLTKSQHNTLISCIANIESWIRELDK